MYRKSSLIILVALSALFASAGYAAQTSVAKYFEDRQGAMALNYDTELYMAGMIHDVTYDPETSAARAQLTLDGWPNIISDCETYGNNY
jgi:hypothetical protein